MINENNKIMTTIERLIQHVRENKKEAIRVCNNCPDGYYPTCYIGESGHPVITTIQQGWDTRRTQLDLGSYPEESIEEILQHEEYYLSN